MFQWSKRQGVYRSSYKNALRMTVTENNIAYRTADFVQQQEMDFVIGIEIRLSDNHPCDDICDDLAGVYPKKFKFTGWHPFCRCYTIPKLAEREELNKWARMSKEERAGYHFKGEVRSMPKKFTDWVERNTERIKSAKSLPYFIKDNSSLVKTATIASDDLSELALMLGVDAGEPMKHEQADMKHPNPHYGEAEEYGINCQSTVVAYELRRRGLPVEAYGKTIDCMGEKLAYNTRAAWIDKDGKIPTPIICKQKIKSRTVDRRGVVRHTYTGIDDIWEEFLSQTSEEGRYHLRWSWEKKNTGHIITMETAKDGTRRFYDPQTGRESGTVLPWIWSKGKALIDLRKGITVYRVDNLRPNPLVVKGVVKKVGSADVAPFMTAEQKEWWANNVEKKATVGVNGNTSLLDWKEKYKKCDFTPETNKSLFRKMGKELSKSSLRSQWSENDVFLKNAYTKSLRINKDALDCLIYHAYTKEELFAISYLRSNLQNLKNAKYCYINMQRKNYKKKIADGAIHIVSYDFEYEGKMFEVKTEVIRMKSNKHSKQLEIPYSLKEK